MESATDVYPEPVPWKVKMHPIYLYADTTASQPTCASWQGFLGIEVAIYPHPDENRINRTSAPVP